MPRVTATVSSAPADVRASRLPRGIRLPPDARSTIHLRRRAQLRPALLAEAASDFLSFDAPHRVLGRAFRRGRQGISRGCLLSPLLAAFFLHQTDRTMERLGLFKARFMDDILVLAPTRWNLRRAVRVVKAELSGLGLEKGPDKTYIGRIERGFDVLGYYFSREGLAVARKTSEQFAARLPQLYAQKKTAPDFEAALGDYVQRWCESMRVGLGEWRFADWWNDIRRVIDEGLVSVSDVSSTVEITGTHYLPLVRHAHTRCTKRGRQSLISQCHR